MTHEEFQKEVSLITDSDLINQADELVSKLCKTGGRSFSMSVPPSTKDSDIILSEIIRRYKKRVENIKLTSLSLTITSDNQDLEEQKEHIRKTILSAFGVSEEALGMMTRELLIQIAKTGFPQTITEFFDWENLGYIAWGDVYRLYDKNETMIGHLPKNDIISVFIEGNFVQIKTGIRSFNQYAAIKKMEEIGLIR